MVERFATAAREVWAEVAEQLEAAAPVGSGAAP